MTFRPNGEKPNTPPFPFQTHPLTCGGPEFTKNGKYIGDICERRSGTGEGELIDKGDYFECPCGAYQQMKYSHDPTHSISVHVEQPKQQEYQPDSIVQSIIQKFRDRAEMGEKKYGLTLDRTDLTSMDYIQHLQEELMDAILYLEKFKTLQNDNTNNKGTTSEIY